MRALTLFALVASAAPALAGAPPATTPPAKTAPAKTAPATRAPATRAPATTPPTTSPPAGSKRGIAVVDAWARATPPGAKVAAGYFTVENAGAASDRLVSASSPAGEVALHKMSMQGGVMRMEPVAGGIVVPPGGSVTLAPGGTHAMFTGIKAPFTEHARVPLTLHFEKAGDVDVVLDVLSIGAKGPAKGGAR